jgi:hypothetical protein
MQNQRYEDFKAWAKTLPQLTFNPDWNRRGGYYDAMLADDAIKELPAGLYGLNTGEVNNRTLVLFKDSERTGFVISERYTPNEDTPKVLVATTIRYNISFDMVPAIVDLGDGWIEILNNGQTAVKKVLAIIQDALSVI